MTSGQELFSQLATFAALVEFELRALSSDLWGITKACAEQKRFPREDELEVLVARTAFIRRQCEHVLQYPPSKVDASDGSTPALFC